MPTDGYFGIPRFAVQAIFAQVDEIVTLLTIFLQPVLNCRKGPQD
jgi:hypothetical protein